MTTRHSHGAQPQHTHDEATWLDDYIANVLLDARNGDINVERDALDDALDVANRIRAGIRDDIANGEGNWLAAKPDTPLAESNSSASPSAFVVAFDTVMPFRVDNDALRAWLGPMKPEDIEFSLPSPDSQYPSRELSCLVCDAINNGAVIGHERLRLAVYEGDDDESTGYYAVLRNANGTSVGITSGWTDLDFADPTQSLVDQVHEHLSAVCATANKLLAAATASVHRSTPAAEGTTQP